MERWPHQIRGVAEVLAAVARGQRRLLLTSPTGGGKSVMICDIIDHLAAEGWYAVLYSNRRMLVDQLRGVLTAHGIDFGVRAAGTKGNDFWPVQISSLPTERARTLKAGTWQLHGLGKRCLVVVDEAHLNDGPTARRIFALHEAAGHYRLGVTATPLGLAASYETLIVAGTQSELRECGALVPCYHYGPDEPDLKSIGKVSLGDDPSEEQQKSAMGKVGSEKFMQLFGRILEWRERLNPEGKPGLLFGPGVAEALGLAERFWKSGVPAAHIDGADTWVNGTFYRADDKARRAVADGSRSGEIKVVCNRFVLREGVDWPWIEHIILAFVCGDLKTYLQIVGRGLRACPGTGKTGLILQDHGGAWWRHGTVNADRDWTLDMTSAMVASLRADAFSKPKAEKEREPARCPKCSKIIYGPFCPERQGGCGWQMPVGMKKTRPVIDLEGNLKEMAGEIFRPRTVSKQADGPKRWERMYWRSRTAKGRRTFRAAFALYAQENNWQWPDRRWPYMPTDPRDEFLLVEDVPFERLVQPAKVEAE